MEKLTVNKKVAIIDYYLSGFSYKEIAAKGHVSKGSVINIVMELKMGQFPGAADGLEQISLLRELAIDLRQSKLTPGQCAVGLSLLRRITEYGLDPGDINRWPIILKSFSSDAEAKEFIRLVYGIAEVQKRTGLGFVDLDHKVHELEQKAADMEPAAKECQEYQKQIGELTEHRKSLTDAIAGMEEKCKELTPRVNDLENRKSDLMNKVSQLEGQVDRLETYIANMNREKQELRKTGLSPEDLAEFNQRFKPIALKHNITPAKTKGRLFKELENMDETLGLETLLRGRQKQMKDEELKVSLAKQGLESLKTTIASLKQEKASLEGSVKAAREEVQQAIEQFIPAVNEAIKRSAVELESGRKEVVAELLRFRDDALEVGKEVGRYEQTLRANQWLIDLEALVKGNESLEAKQVRVIVLAVLRGISIWLKPKVELDRGLSSLLHETENLIREFEQWKV